jgi:hypothetical protein
MEYGMAISGDDYFSPYTTKLPRSAFAAASGSFIVPSVRGCLRAGDSLDGALPDARAAVGALRGIDDIGAVALGDSALGADRLTGAARDARIRVNHMGHWWASFQVPGN